ncbi:MAG: hypothetical protein QGG40_02595 [Myxococcota bacterium]|jgi:hypothetical protein|nr:hypothetical protein [Myxococcota bacterium]
MDTFWPHLRGILVAVHVFAVVAMAAPSPAGTLRRSAWKDPTVQSELATWTRQLRSWGMEIDQDELEEHLWTLARAWTVPRRAILEPLQPYYHYFGTYQSWRMFVAPHRYPTVPHVDVKEGGLWRTVYVARSEEHDWLGHQLNHDRFRSALFRMGWSQYRKTYLQWANWLVVQASRDFPEATHLRVRMHKVRTPTPEEVRTDTAPEGKYQQVKVLELPTGPATGVTP